MKKLSLPSDENGWEIMPGSIVRANLALANMSQRDLEARLKRLDLYCSSSNISSKLAWGTFSAAFFLQALVAIGVETLELPIAKSSDDA